MQLRHCLIGRNLLGAYIGKQFLESFSVHGFSLSPGSGFHRRGRKGKAGRICNLKL
jgi:hypothetical protein